MSIHWQSDTYRPAPRWWSLAALLVLLAAGACMVRPLCLLWARLTLAMGGVA